MTLALLYQYICHPIKTMRYHRALSITNAVWLTLLLIGMTNTASLGSSSPSVLIGSIIVQIVIFSFVVLGLCLCWDFCAQFYGAKAQSLNLFQWIVLANLPNVALLPGEVPFMTAMPALNITAKIIGALVFCTVIVLSVLSIRELYQIKTKHSIIIFLSPILILSLLIGALGLLTIIINPGHAFF